MSAFAVDLAWTRSGVDFAYDTYDRSHRIRFGGGQEIAASAAPDYKGDAAKVNPEEQLIAALASCHMLTFLAICARKRLTVDRYEDAASGVLGKNERGKLWVSEVVLRPRVTFAGAAPSRADLEALHHAAHDNCFVANSVNTAVLVEPR